MVDHTRYSWLNKKQKTTIDTINKKYIKCFQNVVTVASNHEEIGQNPETITKIKPFINHFNWEGTKFPFRKRWLEKIWKK